MGLFSGLFNKEPQEVKTFWKAFNSLLGKSNEKNFEEMAAASAACPDIWQGPFLMGLVMELPNKIAYDEQKANEYHYMAKQIAAKGADGEWVATFYEFYDSSAMNSSYPELYSRESLAVRRLGVAALNCYSNMNPVVYAHEKNDDAKFWYKLLVVNSDYEDCQSDPFSAVFSAWESYRGGKADREWMLSLTNDFIKAGNKITELREKIKKQEKKDRAISEYDRRKSLRMNGYAMACCLMYASPMVLNDWNLTKECGSEFNAGISKLIVEASYGCVASLHLLVNLYFSDDAEAQSMTRYAFRRSGYNVNEDDLAVWLRCGAKAGDAECAKLLQQHFVKD